MSEQAQCGGGIWETCSRGGMRRLDHVQESTRPWCGRAPGHHLPTDGRWWWHLSGCPALLPTRPPHSPRCFLLYSGTEAFDFFPFLAFLPVAEGVKECLGHFPSSAATRAGAESCWVGGQQVLWGMICSPRCRLPGSAPSSEQVWGAGARPPPRCFSRGCSFHGGGCL